MKIKDFPKFSQQISDKLSALSYDQICNLRHQLCLLYKEEMAGTISVEKQELEETIYSFSFFENVNCLFYYLIKNDDYIIYCTSLYEKDILKVLNLMVFI